VELSMNHILELFKCGSLDCGKLSLGFTQNSCVKGHLICENCYLKNIGDNGRCLCGGPFSPMQNHPMRYLATHLEFNCQNNPLLCMASGTGLQAWDEHRRDCTWRYVEAIQINHVKAKSYSRLTLFFHFTKANSMQHRRL